MNTPANRKRCPASRKAFISMQRNRSRSQSFLPWLGEWKRMSLDKRDGSQLAVRLVTQWKFKCHIGL